MENTLIEWHYVWLERHYGYWVKASEKTDFEKQNMEVCNTRFLPSDERPISSTLSKKIKSFS